MTEAPKTLLQMAGAPLQPSRLNESVLLLIDCQNEYVDGALPLPGVRAALGEISRLCDRARSTGTPIIHVCHLGRSGGPFDPAAPRGAIAAPLRVEPGEIRIEKTLPNAFAGTALLDSLRATGRQELIVAGFMTHLCVSSTVRAALDLGLRSTLVAAATATRDLPGPAGETISAEVLQAASLAALADRFAIVVADSDAIES